MFFFITHENELNFNIDSSLNSKQCLPLLKLFGATSGSFFCSYSIDKVIPVNIAK